MYIIYILEVIKGEPNIKDKRNAKNKNIIHKHMLKMKQFLYNYASIHRPNTQGSSI